jgi:hypothetical protein
MADAEAPEGPTDPPSPVTRVGLAARRLVVTVVGGVVLVAGVAMLFTPGPGIAVVAGGLAILATEYDWARRARDRVRERSRAAYRRARASVERRRRDGGPPDPGGAGPAVPPGTPPGPELPR